MAIVIIGNPNSGKSSVFTFLTGDMTLISNFPGTSVELTASQVESLKGPIKVYDTPGVYSLLSSGNEQNAVNQLLATEDIDLVLNVVDATSLERSLVLTYELVERGLPIVIIVNQIDRARQIGWSVNGHCLSRVFNCPVIVFSATNGEGWLELKNIIENLEPSSSALKDLSSKSCRNCSGCFAGCDASISDSDIERLEKARSTARSAYRKIRPQEERWLQKIQLLLERPIAGTIILLAFAYLMFKWLLAFIEITEGSLFELLEPLVNLISQIILQILPPGLLANVLSKAIPEGIIIPFTIIMPAMLMVSILMSIIEDTGVLPRYSVALGRIGGLIGVSGEAIIPLALGFGCRTPAVLATRIMKSETERFITITVLSIIIPCAATLGIFATVIAAFKVSLLVIVLTILAVLVLMGFLLSRLMPQEDSFIYELPPLRLPTVRNIIYKVNLRFSGFFTEVLPLLLVMSIAIRTLIESGFFELFNGMEGVTRSLFGIPAEAFIAVLITIFQRYLAPLVLLNLPLTPREATISLAMIALSLPCLPVMVVTIKEMGWKNLAKIIGLGLVTSVGVGMALNIII
ncbi:MAG: FeoB small GTPase domain-containing protein [Syntrophomonadaceae bacterium]|jgi:ferrous iron transport protein B